MPNKLHWRPKTLLLYNYACHPTVTGPENLMITADFPYAVEQSLNYDVVMFVNGNAGNISTRFTRRDSSFEQVEIYRTELSETLQGLKQISAHFTLMCIQGIKIAVIPGELFSTLGVLLKKEDVEVFGYGNGYYLYIADEKSYDEMVYEAMCSPFEKGVGEFLIEEILKKIRGCQP